MQEKDFQVYVDDILERVRENLVSKATRDYAVSGDKLYNFHTAAPILGSAEMACLSYATKHYLSIAKLVQEKKSVSRELALEKIGDLITYMVIMHALMGETRGKDGHPDMLLFPVSADELSDDSNYLQSKN